jgi:hypothetical protein
MTDHFFIKATPVETLTLPHPKMAWPWAELRIGRIQDEWFVAYDYSLPTGEGGGGPLGYWTSWKERHAHPSRDAALSAGIAELRRRIGDRTDTAKLHLDWLDGLEASLRQPSLFGDAA